MRILLTMNLPYVPAHGGANKGNRVLLEALARRHAVQVVAPALGTPSRVTLPQLRADLAAQGTSVTSAEGVDRFTLHGVEVHAVTEPARLRAHLIEQVRAFAPDWTLISSEDPSQSLLAAALEAHPRRVIYVAHTLSFLPFGPQSFFPSPNRVKLVAQAAAIMSISAFVAQYIRRWGGFDSTVLHLPAYGNGPFPDLGCFDRGYVTLINPCAVKGIAIFLELARRMPDVPFAAVPTWGTTPTDRAALEQLPNVRLLPPADDIDAIFAQTRLLLVPSLWDEAFGLVVVEAMLRGIPVLASTAGGLPEAKLGTDFVLPVRPIERFTDTLDQNLLPVPIVPEQDAGPWQAALRRLLDDRALYEQQSVQARAAAGQFVAGLSAAPFEAFLLRLDAGRPADSAPVVGAPAVGVPASQEPASLPEEIANLTPEQRALLMLRLKKRAATREQQEPAAELITRAPRDGDLPLSFSQQRLWFLDQLEPGSPLYNLFTAVRLAGPLDRPALERSLAAIVQRHEVLRTRFPTVDGRPRQEIAPAQALGILFRDLGVLPAEEREAEARRAALEEARQPFDLGRGPLVRVTLLRIDEQQHILLLTMHHIISDGWSTGIFVREVAAFYTAYATKKSAPLPAQSAPLSAALSAPPEGQSAPLPALPIQYADFAAWQRQWMQGAVQERQLAYWKRQLANLPALALPADRPRPPVQHFQGAACTLTLPAALVEALAEVSRQAEASLFMTLLAAFQALLARYSGQTNIAVGSPIANRNHAQIQGLIGFFVNMLVLRTDLSGNPTFRELLGRVRTVALDAYAHQDLPFERLVEELHPQRDLSRNPLFQVAFTLDNTPDGREGGREGGPNMVLGGLTLSQLAVDNGVAKFDLTLNVWHIGQELLVRMEYNTDLFEDATIRRMIGHFETLLKAITIDPALPVSALPILTEAERQQVLVEWNATAVDAPLDHCIHQLIEAQAARTPDAIAVVYGDRQLTYRALNRRANQLAHYLQGHGVGPDVLVGVCLGRSLDLVIGVLGVLKAGGAYLPLDPTYPAERLQYMLEDAKVAVLLTSQEQRTKLVLSEVEGNKEQKTDRTTERKGVLHTPPADDEGAYRTTPHRTVINLDTEWPTIAQQPADEPFSGVTADNLAYVIYTSGSTGAPKGTMVPHRGTCNLAAAMSRDFELWPERRMLQFAAFSFDASVFEIFSTLAGGATLCLAAPEAILPGPALLGLLRAQAITAVILPPSGLAVLPEAELPALQTLCVAGEACPAELVGRWGGGRRFIDAYGPTEASVCATLTECSGPGKPPIGRPIANTQVYLLDVYMQPVPVGVPGELYIGGAGLARGYLGRPDLTAERFVPNPFAQERLEIGDWRLSGAHSPISNLQSLISNRLYRTGDLCRYRPDGMIEYLGRIDQQVKVRGYRIEPGEIEAALRQHPQVREAVVLAREDTQGERQLVAYVVPNQEQRIKNKEQRSEEQEQRTKLVLSEVEGNKEQTNEKEASQFSILNSQFSGELRQFLRDRLPDYMIPVAFVLIEALPLSPSGKIDRQALPAPGAARPAVDAPFLAPRSSLERMIAGVWRSVLHLETVGVHDNFFDLGGHSLRLVAVQSRLRAELGRDVALLDLFKHPTISALATFLAPDQSADAALTLDAAPRATPQGGPIAIVGMSGRFPSAPSVEAFWALLRDGVDTVTSFTDAELLAAGVDPALLANPHYVKARPVLDEIDRFDAGLFGYSPREAELLDPQQRLFLEVAWEALERAGYAPLQAPGRVGVFAGVALNSYVFNLINRPEVLATVGETQVVISNDKDYLATRVSYKLRLSGPSITVQTACSTSLVAVHLACQSLRLGEADMALAGGVSVQSSQVVGYRYLEGGIGSPDGHCRPFDAAAQGTVGGSGLGIVVLKRLDDALRDGDTILALIRGSAINNDGGHKVGYTAPSVRGQAQVIRAALHQAALDPSTISYVEAHGTGTALGDPIEVAALTEVFGPSTQRPARCALGAVKSNIGHLDAAAGVAGLIKTTLALQHRQLPPSLHFHAPNPQIDFANSPFYVNTELRDWESDGAPRRAGISSFGIGGTNAHVIVEEAPAPQPGAPGRPWQLLILSAQSEAALETATDQLAAHLRQHPDQPLADIAFTLQHGRSPLAHRRVLAGQTHADLAEALAARDPARLSSGHADGSSREVAFLFPGQGAQHAGMTHELYQTEPVFRAEIDRCATILMPHLGLDIREVLYPKEQGTKNKEQRSDQPDPVRRLLRGRPADDLGEGERDGRPADDLGEGERDGRPADDLGEGETSEAQRAGWRGGEEENGQSPISNLQSPLDQTQYTQPALFVVEYALAQLWMNWGIQPQALLGHSLGEYVAACLAGVFSLDDALKLVAARGRLMQQTQEGAMLSIPLPAEALAPWLDDELELAAINAPELCVVSGPVEAIERLAAALAAEGLECRRLPTERAFHSRLMDAVLEPFAAEVARVALHPPKLPFISNVSGTWITAEEATDPRYWVRQIRVAVRFGPGLAELLRADDHVLLEVGPGRALGSLARRQAGAERVVLASLPHPSEERAESAAVLTALGRLWLAGVPIEWARLHAGAARRRVLLPTYPFERRRYWIEHQPASLPARASARRSDLADWFYLPSWKRVPPLKPFKPTGEQRRLLVFGDRCGVGEQVLERLRAAGQEVVEVRAAAQFGRPDEHVYTLDPRQRAHYDALIGELRAADRLPHTIVHLWNVFPSDVQRPPSELFDTCQDRGLYSLLFLAQALEQRAVTDPLHLLVVSNNLHAVHWGEPLVAEKTTIEGACKVIPQEYPNIRCRSVDIVLAAAGSGDATHLAEQLLAEIAAPSSDPVVAYRGPHRWVQGVEAMPLDDAAGGRARLRERGVYLITGGLGEIGLALAEELAREMQARLVLIGRTAMPTRADWAGWLAAHPDGDPTSGRIRRVQALEAHGAEVLLLSADAADEAQMRAALAQAEARFGPIHGVIHSAGVAKEQAFTAIQATDRGVCEAHFQPKARGLYVLEKVLQGKALDFCVLHSSLSATLGGLGFAAYAAANRFIDAFAQERRRQSGAIPWISVDWDGWHTPAEADDQRVGALGHAAILPGEGGAAFTRLLSIETLPQVLVSTTDLQARLDQWVHLKPADAAPAGETTAQHARPNLQGAYVAPSTPIEQTIAEIWQTVLGIQQIGANDNFFEAGGHSLLATQVISRIRERFQVELPLRRLFETPTVAEIALVVTHSQGQAQGEQTTKIDRADRGNEQQLLAGLDQLSEAEVETLLNTMLAGQETKGTA